MEDPAENEIQEQQVVSIPGETFPVEPVAMPKADTEPVAVESMPEEETAQEEFVEGTNYRETAVVSVGDLVTLSAPEANVYEWRRDGAHPSQRSESGGFTSKLFHVSFNEPGDYSYSVLYDGERKHFDIQVN